MSADLWTVFHALELPQLLPGPVGVVVGAAVAMVSLETKGPKNTVRQAHKKVVLDNDNVVQESVIPLMVWLHKLEMRNRAMMQRSLRTRCSCWMWSLVPRY